jgi:hypothetical protein
VAWDPSYSGTASIRVKSVNPCNESPWSDPLDVLVNPTPAVNLGKDTTITFADTLVLDAGNPGASYLWSTGANTQTIPAFYTGLASDTYWVTVTALNCTSGDTIVIQFTDPSSAGEKEKWFSVHIIPNPNTGQFFLEIFARRPGDASLQILDITGRVIFEKEVDLLTGTTKLEISLPLAGNGLYYLRLKQGEETISGKVLIFR